jgi:hypothetical protein
VDYIETMIEMMPEIERKEQGLEIQLSLNESLLETWRITPTISK